MRARCLGDGVERLAPLGGLLGVAVRELVELAPLPKEPSMPVRAAILAEDERFERHEREDDIDDPTAGEELIHGLPLSSRERAVQ